MARAAEQLPRRLAPLIWPYALPLLCALPFTAHAQTDPKAGAQASPSPATTQAAAEPQRKTEGSRVVLFLLPADASDSQALRDALSAQFALIDAQLVFESEGRENEGSLSRRFTLAQELAANRGAIAVFWIDLPPDGRWLLHMMDPADDRVIVRSVDASGERRQAAIEAVAVMTRSSTRALIEDQAEPPPAAAMPAPPPPPPAPIPAAEPEAQPEAQSQARNERTAEAHAEEAASTRPPDWLRLWVGYTGDHFAPKVWQHGISLGAGYVGFPPFPPLYASGGIALVPAIDVRSETVRFSVRRLPFNVRVGYRLRSGMLVLDAELGFLVEWLHRPPSEGLPVMGVVVTSKGSRDSFLYALGPRLRVELRFAPAVGLYAGGGLDILLNDFAYVSHGIGAGDLLRPDRVRPVAELGISFYP